MPPDYAVIDVETTELQSGFIPETKFWGYADSHGYERFETTRQLRKFLDTRSPKFLLHHSNFDVIQILVDRQHKDFSIRNSHDGKLIRCFWGKHTLQNTFTVFPVALKKIFAAFGYKKTSLKNLDKRNYEDCVNGLDCFTRLDRLFFDLVGVSPLQTGTVAGTTFRAAETFAGKMPKDLRFLHAYRGGRVEVFDTRETRAYNYDIHSSYPASFLDCPEKDNLLHLRVKTRDYYAPFFDAACQEMLIFPNGTFETWIFESNLERYILPNCEKTSLRKLSKHAINLSWLRALQPLVSKIYEQKQTAKDEGIKLCSKFLLNAFYGRIGLRPESEKCSILGYEKDGDDCTSYRLAKNLWLCFEKVQRETRSNYPFAAFITDNARARLYRAFARNNPVYGDTDSIFTATAPRAFKETIGPDCGQWAFEGCGNFRARNVKDYDFDGETTRKGGSKFLEWTLKRFCAGKTVAEIVRNRRTGLRKRETLPSGETLPLTKQAA